MHQGSRVFAPNLSHATRLFSSSSELYSTVTARCLPQNLKSQPNMPDYQAEKGIETCIGACVAALVTTEASFDLIYSVLHRSCRRQSEAILGRILRRWRRWKNL